jgi:hypothetical protein
MNPKDTDEGRRSAVVSPNVWILVIVVLATAVGVWAVLRMDRSGEAGSGLAERAEYKIEQYSKIDPALIRYSQQSEIATGMSEARAVAVGPADRIYVAGDKAIHLYELDGTLIGKTELEHEPTCLAVGASDHAMPRSVYVGMKDHVEVLNPEQQVEAAWDPVQGKAQLTSIAVAKEDVFVADAGNRVVLRYDTGGSLLGRIGERDKEHGIAGLVIPSPFFDVAVAPDDLLWVVNPGATRLEAYSSDGRIELFWGEGGAGIEAFFGCCNPANFTILSDGRFVTAEKGLLRVKVYTADGQLDCFVAGPEQLEDPTGNSQGGRFDHENKALDVACDSKDRIVILDLTTSKLRIYEPKQDAPAQEAEEPNEAEST